MHTCRETKLGEALKTVRMMIRDNSEAMLRIYGWQLTTMIERTLSGSLDVICFPSRSQTGLSTSLTEPVNAGASTRDSTSLPMVSSHLCLSMEASKCTRSASNT